MSEDPMFDIEVSHVHRGTRVVVRTIYGPERGMVLKLNHDREGYPQAKVLLENGTSLTIGIARLEIVDE